LEGEAVRAVARDFPISEAAIRERFAKIGKIQTVQAVARKIIDTENSLAALPIAAQVSAQNLAAKLRSISDNLAGAAMHGAATAHRLNALANSEVGKVDDAEPLKSLKALRGVSVLSKLANESASVALNLLAANKPTVERINRDEPTKPSIDPKKLSDATLQELLDARANAV
jgi:hypothetical protein